jgi:CarD family transcriptional regulator
MIEWEETEMYQCDELVVYGSTGVCRVVDVVKPYLRGEDRDKLFYQLDPLYQDGVIYTPVQGGKVQMRPVMSAEDARNLIAKIPSVHVEPCRERTLQLLSQRYQSALQSGDSLNLLKMTMSVRAKRVQAESRNRRLGAVDERYGRQAERLLFGELAVALDMPMEQVKTYIATCVEDDQQAM